MNSKIEMRLEAVRLAVNTEGVTADNVIDLSEKIATFILGDSRLPETYNANEVTTRLMESFTQMQRDGYGKSQPEIKQEAAEA